MFSASSNSLWDPPAIATHNARRRLPAFPGIGGQGGILAATVAAGKPLPLADWTIFPQMRDEPIFFRFYVLSAFSANSAVNHYESILPKLPNLTKTTDF